MRQSIITLFLVLGLIQQSNAQLTGTTLFDESYVHTIELTFFETNYWDTLEAHYDEMIGDWFNPGTGIKQYLPTTCVIDGIQLDSVGARHKGNYSNWGTPGLKKPFKLDFNEFVAGQKYEGLKKLNLQNGFQDPSMLRDALSNKMLRDMGIPAPRTSYAKLYINGNYWGLYILVEQVNKAFLEENFTDNSGNLFKCIDNTDLLWQGVLTSAYNDEFELKTNEATNDWSQFIRFVDIANNTLPSRFKDSLEAILNVDLYLKTLAIDVLLNNWDSYYDHGRNFYLYNDPQSNKFVWIPWDYNLSFSEDEVDLMLTNIQGSGGVGIPVKPLNDNILANEDLKVQYLSEICRANQQVFNLATQENYIDSTSTTIRADLSTDPNKFYSITDFDNSVVNDVVLSSVDPWGFPQTESFKGIKSYIDNRYNTVELEVEDLGYTCAELLSTAIVEHNSAKHLQVYPNPTSGLVNIYTQVADSDKVLIVYNSQGKQVVQKNLTPLKHYYSVNLEEFGAGVYYVTQGIMAFKIVVY